MSTARRHAAAVLLCLSGLLCACTPPPLERVPVLYPTAPQQRMPQQVPAQPVPQRPQTQPMAQPQPQLSQRPPVRPPLATDPLDARVYQLSTGDVVRIDVLGEPELSLETHIDPSGYINYPFLGRIAAGGQTVRGLEQQIRSGLAAGYLVNPDVRVSLAQYRPVFVSGEVRQAGAFPYSLGLTVKQALALAGGISTYGSENRVYLQRPGAGNERLRVDLDTRVLPGDTIVVDERLF